MDKLTHTDETGRARMVDVGSKSEVSRVATATGYIRLGSDTLKLINENMMKKGDVLTVAQIAGIAAAKQTSQLIPLCHNIVIDSVSVILTPDSGGVRADSEVRCQGRTGVEMEALTAVSVALLTVYDMCKAVDKAMVIEKVELTGKRKS